MFFLDTNICIYALQGASKRIKSFFEKLEPEHIKIPAIVKAELLLGAEKSVRKQKTFEAVCRFLMPFEVLPFDEEGAVFYAKIRGLLEKKGMLIGPNDLIVAATVLAFDGILVTHNTKEFSRIRQLPIEDWY